MKKTPKLRFKEFSGDWEEKKLGELANLTSSKRIFASDYVTSGIPFYRGKEITELKQGKQPDDILYITNEKYDEIKNKFGAPKEGELLLTAVGTLGNSYVICDSNPFYFKDGNLIWFQNININANYLDTMISSEKGKKKILDSAIGSTQKALTIVELNKLKYKIPKIEEQEKIAKFFSLIDNKISLQSEKVEALKDYKKGIMQKIFSRELRFKDDEGRDYPEWEEKKVEECVDIFLGLTYTPTYVQKGIPFLSVKDISNSDEICFDNIKYISEDEYKNATSNAKPQKGDILFGRVGTLGNPIVINEEIDICIFVSLGFLRVKNDNISNIFISHWMKSESFLKQVEKKIAGSSQKNLNTGWLKSFDIEIPSIKEQNKICILLDSLDKKLKLEQEKLNSLNEYKKGLLQQMFI